MTMRAGEFAEKRWVKSLRPRYGHLWKVMSRIHYRLVMNTVGYSLSNFEGSQELLNVNFDDFIHRYQS